MAATIPGRVARRTSSPPCAANPSTRQVCVAYGKAPSYGFLTNVLPAARKGASIRARANHPETPRAKPRIGGAARLRRPPLRIPVQAAGGRDKGLE